MIGETIGRLDGGKIAKAYAAEAGFEVPTIVFTTSELAALTARGDELHAGHDGEVGNHYVTLYATAPTAEIAARWISAVGRV